MRQAYRVNLVALQKRIRRPHNFAQLTLNVASAMH